jgi:hypothetical protein
VLSLEAELKKFIMVIKAITPEKDNPKTKAQVGMLEPPSDKLRFIDMKSKMVYVILVKLVNIVLQFLNICLKVSFKRFDFRIQGLNLRINKLDFRINITFRRKGNIEKGKKASRDCQNLQDRSNPSRNPNLVVHVRTSSEICYNFDLIFIVLMVITVIITRIASYSQAKMLVIRQKRLLSGKNACSQAKKVNQMILTYFQGTRQGE